MFAVNAISMMNYTMMANNAVFRGLSANNARLGLLSSCDPNMNPQQLAQLSAIDTQLELDALTCGLQYKYAKAMLESLKKLQDDDIKRSFSVFA